MNIEAKIQKQSRRMQEYLENKDDLRMTPKRAGLTHTGPSNYDTCKMPSPAEKFSKLTLSSRKRSNNLELCSTQSPAGVGGGWRSKFTFSCVNHTESNVNEEVGTS